MNGIRVNFSTVCDILGLGQQIRQQRGGVPIGQEVSNFVNGPENIRKYVNQLLYDFFTLVKKIL